MTKTNATTAARRDAVPCKSDEPTTASFMTTPKRSRGRPRLPDVMRTQSMHVAASPAAWRRYMDAAQADGVSVSEWMRDAAERKLKSRKRAAKGRG